MKPFIIIITQMELVALHNVNVGFLRDSDIEVANPILMSISEVFNRYSQKKIDIYSPPSTKVKLKMPSYMAAGIVSVFSLIPYDEMDSMGQLTTNKIENAAEKYFKGGEWKEDFRILQNYLKKQQCK
jgi:hypothetical protein